MRSFFVFATVALAVCSANPGWAQQGEARREAVSRAFMAGAPDVGEPFPEPTIYDDAGREFLLRSLRGKYTVLVFGCLT
jgi:hypothetical protein